MNYACPFEEDAEQEVAMEQLHYSHFDGFDHSYNVTGVLQFNVATLY